MSHSPQGTPTAGGGLGSASSGGVQQSAFSSGALSTSVASVANKLGLGFAHLSPLGATRVDFVTILQTSNPANLAYADLFCLSSGAVVAGSEVSTAATVPTRIVLAVAALLTLPAGLYQARLWMAPQAATEIITCLGAGLVTT